MSSLTNQLVIDEDFFGNNDNKELTEILEFGDEGQKCESIAPFSTENSSILCNAIGKEIFVPTANIHSNNKETGIQNIYTKPPEQLCSAGPISHIAKCTRPQIEAVEKVIPTNSSILELVGMNSRTAVDDVVLNNQVILQQVGKKSNSAIAEDFGSNADTGIPHESSRSHVYKESPEVINGVKHYQMSYTNNVRFVDNIKIQYRTGQSIVSSRTFNRKNRKRTQRQNKKKESTGLCSKYYREIGLYQLLVNINYVVKVIDTGRDDQMTFEGSVFCLGPDTTEYPWRIAILGTEVDLFLKTEEMLKFASGTLFNKLINIDIGRAAFRERTSKVSHENMDKST